MIKNHKDLSCQEASSNIVAQTLVLDMLEAENNTKHLTLEVRTTLLPLGLRHLVILCLQLFSIL